MKNKLHRICVFSGSNTGSCVEYADAAQMLGVELVNRGLELVYGGGNVGLMGIVADTVMQQGGNVVGVIPEFLAKKEVAHTEISHLHIVDSMHERKALMSELSDAFIALPGGLGTFDELLEVLTWNQLGVQAKPCAVLNTGGYFTHLLQQLDHAVSEQFLKPVHRNMLLAGTTAENILNLIADYTHPHADKWINKNSKA